MSSSTDNTQVFTAIQLAGSVDNQIAELESSLTEQFNEKFEALRVNQEMIISLIRNINISASATQAKASPEKKKKTGIQKTPKAWFVSMCANNEEFYVNELCEKTSDEEREVIGLDKSYKEKEVLVMNEQNLEKKNKLEGDLRKIAATVFYTWANKNLASFKDHVVVMHKAALEQEQSDNESGQLVPDVPSPLSATVAQ